MRLIKVDYTNWEGKRRIYVLQLMGDKPMFWGSNEWHPKPQWLLCAKEVGREGIKTYAMENVHSWENVS